MKKSAFNSTNAMILAALGTVINIVLGSVVNMLHIPLLFMDTIGTIFIAVVLGPLAGALTGGLTNVILSFTTNPKEMLFAIVNIVIGIVVGFIAKKWKFNLKTAVITGLILSIVAPLIGTPIAVYVYGGLTGDGNDLLFAWLYATGHEVFTSAFIPRITGNFVDKIASCVLVSLILRGLPKSMLVRYSNHA
jgi:energy-coupling factor transport system substrate-specific component